MFTNGTEGRNGGARDQMLSEYLSWAFSVGELKNIPGTFSLFFIDGLLFCILYCVLK